MSTTTTRSEQTRSYEGLFPAKRGDARQLRSSMHDALSKWKRVARNFLGIATYTAQMLLLTPFMLVAMLMAIPAMLLSPAILIGVVIMVIGFVVTGYWIP